MDPMKVTITAGTRGWFEMKFQGTDSVTFKRDSIVDVESYQVFWYKTYGQIVGLPDGHPGVLINEIYLPKERA
jgi:hypothetical protein